MNGAITGFLVLIVIALVVAIAYVVARGKARGHEPGRPDALSDEVTGKLMAELRRVVYADLGLPLNKDGTAFDLELARQNEEEAQALDGDRRGMPETDETE